MNFIPEYPMGMMIPNNNNMPNNNINGIINKINELENKIRSENYLSLFKKIGKKLAASPNSTFTKNEFEDVLTNQNQMYLKISSVDQENWE